MMNYDKVICNELRLIRMSLSVIALALRKIAKLDEDEVDDGVENDLPY